MEKKVGIGFIGTGFARSVQMPAFAACEGARLVSVASGTPGNAENTAAAVGIEHFSDDWRETASHPDVDLVCITTPPVNHSEMTLFAIEHGKHVLCEKPMAMSVAEAEEMQAAAERAGVMALIDHELRFQPGRLEAYRLLREGAIGRVRHAKYNFRAPHRGDPNIAWNWWSDVSSGGGALGAIGSHVIDSFQWLLGTPISSVFCQLQTHVKDRPFGSERRAVTTDDESNMLLRFGNGELTDDATGMVALSMVEHPGYLNRLEIFGTGGSLRIEGRGDVYSAANGDPEWTPIEVPLGTPIEGVADTGFSRGFMELAPRIIEALASGQASVEHAATFADGVSIQKVLDAARESSTIGAAVAVRS
jgi:predicted dehydrogenase